MAAITGADFRGILQFLDVAAADTATEPLPRPILFALGELIPADEVSYFELRRKGRERGASPADRGGSVVAHSTTRDTDSDEPWVEEVMATFGYQNPVGAVLPGFGPASGAVRQSKVISRRALEKLDRYHCFLKPLRHRDTLKVWLHSSPETVACVSFERSDMDFSDREVAILGVLQTHLTVLRANALTRHGKVRRNNLYYLRGRTGKAARIKERRIV